MYRDVYICLYRSIGMCAYTCTWLYISISDASKTTVGFQTHMVWMFFKTPGLWTIACVYFLRQIMGVLWYNSITHKYTYSDMGPSMSCLLLRIELMRTDSRTHGRPANAQTHKQRSLHDKWYMLYVQISTYMLLYDIYIYIYIHI